MMLGANTFQQAKALIDLGVRADNTYPEGHAYLVKTHDRARSTRTAIFKRFVHIWQQNHNVHAHFIDDSHKKNDTSIKHKKDILFYQTGLKHVPDISTNRYLPGAIADHLTSGAGVGIGHDGQMKAFRWLESGLTGSYGAVIEPCNFTEKFPNPQILIPSYTAGDSLIEAYWKSVQQPGEGLFIGEPLARPWSKTILTFQGRTLIISTIELDTNQNYLIEERTSPDEKWRETPNNVTAKIKKNHLEIHIPNAKAKLYRISKKPFYFGIMRLPE
ncbi:MAG: TIGR03790 family protein [Piscirickettsiaceae bacterium]|nr:TIGR03790 family protein [Piscirickettsiaceae bacterium]